LGGGGGGGRALGRAALAWGMDSTGLTRAGATAAASAAAENSVAARAANTPPGLKAEAPVWEGP